MAKKGFLAKALSAVADWYGKEYPPADVKEELRQQGWQIKTHFVVPMGGYTMGPVNYSTTYTPEGKLVSPGNEADRQYQEALKVATEKCALRKNKAETFRP